MEQLPDNLTLDQVLEAAENEENVGYCLSCGEMAYQIEPDARNCLCESCGSHAVYGAEEMIFNVWLNY